MTPEPPLGYTPDERNAWFAGVESCRRGLPITTDHPYCCAMKDVWEMGWKAAMEEPGLETPAPTTQSLIDAFEKAHAELRELIKTTLPIGCAVMVKSLRYEGPGRVTYYPRELQPENVAVTLPNGNELYFLATNVRRVL